jgi:hypothetical protein
LRIESFGSLKQKSMSLKGIWAASKSFLENRCYKVAPIVRKIRNVISAMSISKVKAEIRMKKISLSC